MLDKKKKYLQIALNSNLSDAASIIRKLPISDRIILEAGTPLLKRHGAQAISFIKKKWAAKTQVPNTIPSAPSLLSLITNARKNENLFEKILTPNINIVADYKTMDRGETEVAMAKLNGATAITVLGSAPKETINQLMTACREYSITPIIDMMNVANPVRVLRSLKKVPPIVMLHRGVDEEKFGQTRFPIHLINKIKGSYNVQVAVGGGDTLREVQSAVFNGADIVMLWKDFYSASSNVEEITEEFLTKIR